ncbi:GTPase ObgE [Patescibacteria group bacterium]|nr:GTPase ObgE [Patescibacteria group bacterium]
MTNFIDLCQIKVIAGAGGNGMVSFCWLKGKRRAETDGGNGGSGGSIYLRADSNLDTLYDFTRQRVFTVECGQRGGSNKKKGADGENLILRVPVGTVVREVIERQSDRERERNKEDFSEQALKKSDSDLVAQPLSQPNRSRIFVDLSEPQQDILVARGGRGGRGNVSLPRNIDVRKFPDRFRFFSGKQKMPSRYCWAEKGVHGEEKELVLELKLIADVGLIGLPNAGKTTLLNKLTASRAQVGGYPFTTLSPNLGVMRVNQATERYVSPRPTQLPERSIVMADIPGLIEGSAEGKGLGDDFLRHVERTKVLLHILDPLDGLLLGDKSDDQEEKIAQNTLKNYLIIRDELRKWSSQLEDKLEIVVINKLDVTEIREAITNIRNIFNEKLDKDTPPRFISAATGEGLTDLKTELFSVIR